MRGTLSRPVAGHVNAGDLARFAFDPHLEPEVAEEIRQHLSEGCDPCARRLVACRRAGPDLSLPPLFTGGWIVPRRVDRPGDRRAGVLADYELVCGAGNYELDVIVREIESPHRLDIGGQLTTAAALHDPARGVPLSLLDASDDDVVSSARTDEFGEFDFSAASGVRYGLRIGDRSDSPCVLVWDGVR